MQDHTLPSPLLFTTTLLLCMSLLGCEVKRVNTLMPETPLSSADAGMITETLERGVTPGPRVIVLDGFNGDITLTGTAEPYATLSFIKLAYPAEGEARSMLDGISVEESGDQTSYRFTVRSRSPEETAVRIQGTIPYHTPVHLILLSGNLALTDIQGPITIQNRLGDVVIDGSTGPLDISIENGSISIGLLALDQGQASMVKTDLGHLELVATPDLSAQVNMRTEVGTFSLEGLPFEQAVHRRVKTGHIFEGTLGQGLGTLSMATLNGNLSLRVRAEAPPLPEQLPTPSPAQPPPSPEGSPTAPADSSGYTAPTPADSTSRTSSPADSTAGTGTQIPH